MADAPNNSVVIYANQQSYHIIEKALEQLDRPKLQVAIDTTIAEVTLNDTLSYGVQFFLGSIQSWPRHQATTASPASQASNSAGNKHRRRRRMLPGFNLLLGNNLTPHVVLNALHQYTNVKVLSNPSLVVVDNQVATLTVGDQIPVTTGSANILNSATSSSNTVFNSINYENTGIILRVQPRVNFNGNVTLDVDQEISECKNCAAGTNLTPTISDRHVKSSIVVADGQTVLLAGLIQDSGNLTKSGIPGLDQIPVHRQRLQQQLQQFDRTDRTHHLHPSAGHPRRRRRLFGRRGAALQDARREGRQHLSDGGRDAGADAGAAAVEPAMTPPMIQRGAAMGEAPPAPLTAGGWVRSGWLKTAGLAVLACAMTGASLSAARGAQGWFGAALALLMLAIAVIDARSLLIPNRLSLAAFLLGLAAAGLGASPEFWRVFGKNSGFPRRRPSALP